MQWQCTICGYVHDDEEPPGMCPICGAPDDKFIEYEANDDSIPDGFHAEEM